MELQIITIHIPNILYLKISPVDNIIYKVEGLNDRLCVFYKFEYRDETVLPHKTISNKITYYISDGRTNNLRLNLLLPFLCIRDELRAEQTLFDDNITNCLISNRQNLSNIGLVYKYTIDAHLNYSNIIQDIRDYIKKTNPSEPRKTMHWSDNNIGIFSVLDRFENIIDFIMAISNYKIHNLITNYEYNDYNIYNIKIKRKIDGHILDGIELETFELNFISYDDYENDIKLINDSNIDIYSNEINELKTIKPERTNRYKTLFRLILVKLLAIWHIKLKNICNIEYIKCNINNISLKDLNILINTCNGNEYSKEKIVEYNNYKFIANSVYTKLFSIIMPLYKNTIQFIFKNQNISLKDTMNNNWSSDCTPNKHKYDKIENNIYMAEEEVVILFVDKLNKIYIQEIDILSDREISLIFKYYYVNNLVNTKLLDIYNEYINNDKYINNRKHKSQLMYLLFNIKDIYILHNKANTFFSSYDLDNFNNKLVIFYELSLNQLYNYLYENILLCYTKLLKLYEDKINLSPYRNQPDILKIMIDKYPVDDLTRAKTILKKLIVDIDQSNTLLKQFIPNLKKILINIEEILQYKQSNPFEKSPKKIKTDDENKMKYLKYKIKYVDLRSTYLKLLDGLENPKDFPTSNKNKYLNLKNSNI